MNVKISYTVPFQEVPSRVQRLIMENRNVSEEISEKLTQIQIDDERLVLTLNEIDNIRKLLFKIDTQLGDCYNILSGYNKALADMLTQKEEASDVVGNDSDNQDG